MRASCGILALGSACCALAEVVKFPESPAFTVLINNTLESSVVETIPSYLLLTGAQTKAQASAACNQLGENLSGVDNITSIKPLIVSYLRNSNKSHSQSFWLNASDMDCVAFNPQSQDAVHFDCNKRLQALCTNTAVYQTGMEAPSANVSVFINTPQGYVKGFRDKLTARFQGIPYAKPPVGSRRLANPQKMQTLPSEKYGAYDATKFKAICPQVLSPNPHPVPNLTVSEDCLYLNVFTPQIPGENTTDLLPVMLWIHGGSYYYGGSSFPYYLGMNMATRQSMVVVTIDYRLGALGFLSDPFSNSSQAGSNQAMRDQILALEWVQEQIRSYGGDPNRVTILGESAGGTSVMSLLQTPAAKGLFSNAIIESGNTLSGWQRPDIQSKLTHLFLNISGCNDLDCVKYNLTTAKIIEHQAALFAKAQEVFPRGMVSSLEPFRPYVDGNLILEDWNTALDSGRYHRVPTLYIRTQTGHFTTAENYLATFLLGRRRTQQVLDTPSLGFNSSLVNQTDVTSPFVNFTTNYWYRCNGKFYAGYLERHNPNVWELTWEFNLPQFIPGLICGNGTGRVCHGSEIPLFFGSGSYANFSATSLASVSYLERARSSLDLYGRFVHSGVLKINETAVYPRRGDNQTHNVLHWNDYPEVRQGGVHWSTCAKMEEMKLYDRLYYPLRSTGLEV